jgi:transposase-like protein
MSEERRFSRDFKLAALARMEAGENVSALARELDVRRKYLYQWRDRFRTGGPVALRSRGRPTKAEALAIQSGDTASVGLPAVSSGPMPQPAPPDALAKAQRRITELERKVGQQQVDLDFFQAALRQVREARQVSGASGGTASTRSSKR